VIQSRMGLERAVLELSAMLDEARRLWEEAACGSGGGGHSGGGGREAGALCDAARTRLAVADCHRPSNGGVMQTMGKLKCMCPGAV
jgi:hypothetical protein